MACVEYIRFVFPTEVFLLSSCRCKTFPKDHKSGIPPSSVVYSACLAKKKNGEATQNRRCLLHCTHKMALIAFYVHFLQRILWTSKAVKVTEPDASCRGKDTCKKEKIHSTPERACIENWTSAQVISFFVNPLYKRTYLCHDRFLTLWRRNFFFNFSTPCI